MPLVRLRKTVGVTVGHLQVGGGAPIVVQSMTMTDTADARATARAVHRAGRGGIGDGARHGQPARGRRGRAGDQAAHARRRLHRAAHRRLSLQRPPAAHAVPGVRGGARQVPHQSGQRRHRQAPRRAVLDHLQGGRESRQARAHRRQRRFAQPGARHVADAGEHGSRSRQDLGRRHQRVPGDLGDRVHGARDRMRASHGSDRHFLQDVAAARSDRRLPGARDADRPAAPPGPDRSRAWARRGSSGRRRRWACCSTRESATRFASR